MLPRRNASPRESFAWRTLSRFAGDPPDLPARKRRRGGRPRDGLPEDCPGQLRDGLGRATPPSRCFRCIRRRQSQEYSTKVLHIKRSKRNVRVYSRTTIVPMRRAFVELATRGKRNRRSSTESDHQTSTKFTLSARRSLKRRKAKAPNRSFTSCAALSHTDFALVMYSL